MDEPQVWFIVYLDVHFLIGADLFACAPQLRVYVCVRDHVYTIGSKPIIKVHWKADQLMGHGSGKWCTRAQYVRRQEQHLSSHQQRGILGRRDCIQVSLSVELTAAAAALRVLGWRTDTPSCARLFSDSVFRLGVSSLC